MKKVEIVECYGKRIVQIDFSGCAPEAYGVVLAEAERVIRAEPPASVRTLTLVEHTHFGPEAVEEMSGFAARVSKHLRGSAVVGVTGLKKVIFGGIRPHYQAPVGLFDDPETAKEWLARH
jgi:hypothetical protein